MVAFLGILHGKPKFLFASTTEIVQKSTPERDPRKTSHPKVESLSSDSAPLYTLHCGIEVLINIEKDQLLCDFGFVCAKQMKIEKESRETPRMGATANELGLRQEEISDFKIILDLH